MDSALENYLCKVWKKTSRNILLSLFTGMLTTYLMSNSFFQGDDVRFFYAMGAASLVSFFAIFKFHLTTPVYGNDDRGNAYLADCQSNRDRETWADVIFLMMGIVISPPLYMAIKHDILFQALIVTAASTLGPITASFHMPNGYLLKYRASVHTILTGLLFISLGGIYYPLLHDISVYGGVLFFAFLNAYDTHVAIGEYRNGTADHVGHAVNYGLNILNLFIRIIDILIRLKRQEQKRSSPHHD